MAGTTATPNRLVAGSRAAPTFLSGSPEGRRAYATVATQMGMDPQQVAQITSLAVNPDFANLANMAQRIDLARANMDTWTGKPYDRKSKRALKSMSLPGGEEPLMPATDQPPQSTEIPAGSRVPMLFGDTPQTGTRPMARDRGFVPGGPAAPRRREGAQIVAGAPNARAAASGAAGRGNYPSAEAGRGPTPADLVGGGRSTTMGRAAGPFGGAYAVPGPAKATADAVTAATVPTTMQDLGLDTDTAEQFQALEKMLAKSLPEGFDLREDYARDPAFYKRLLLAIQKGVPDPKNPGQRRKLSVNEILQLITGA